MRLPVRAALVAGLLLLGCPNNGGQREICGNGFDDDGNGLADCADADCAGQAACPNDGGQFGPCAKCGEHCAVQSFCLQYGYGSDAPLPDCAAGRCQSFNQALQIALEVDTQANWRGVTATLRSMNTRFVRKTALDGSAVTCATLSALATGKTAADADQLEKSGRFNLVGFDVTPLTAPAGTIIRQPFVNVGTAEDFVIWVELWLGPRDATTKLPTGNRAGWGCFESGAAVAPLVPADHCPATPVSPTCRTLRVEMPPPQ